MNSEMYLFCDIDGVLNSELKEDPIDSEIVEMILKLQSDYNVKIIINSKASWFKVQYENKISILKNEGLIIYDEIIRNTITANPKGYEIAAYLKKHPDIQNFIIIDDNDDEYSFFEELKTRFVKTKAKHGLTQEDLNKIVDLIKNF